MKVKLFVDERNVEFESPLLRIDDRLDIHKDENGYYYIVLDEEETMVIELIDKSAIVVKEK